MDSATRMHVRRQIDAANRKKLGLPARRAVVVRQRSSTGNQWSDDAIAKALARVARIHDCSVAELRLADYRRTIHDHPGVAPAINTLKKRLAAGVAGCPERLK